MKKAFLLIDLQNDFLPGGPLAVSQSDQLIPLINKALQLPFDLKVASQDFHPIDHVSFYTNHENKAPFSEIDIMGKKQTLWPPHCVQNTFGAEINLEINSSGLDKIIYKGTKAEIDSYSAFFDNHKSQSTGLADYLKSHQIEKVYLAGLALDFCVKYSALDAVSCGFETYVIKDLCKAVNLNPGDDLKAISEMANAGVNLLQFIDLKNMF